MYAKDTHVRSNLSDSQKSWITREHDRPAGMEVRLLIQTVVLPWNQFICAEGDHEKSGSHFPHTT